MTTPANTPTTDSDSEIDISSPKPTQNPNASPNFIDPLIANPSRAPVVCLFRFAGDASAGAIMGSIFGLGSGFVKRKGFKGALGEASVNAKTFAVLSGVHSLVVCLLKRLRGKDDVINAGVAGCCTGLALSFPGAPQALLQSCVTFGAFSCIIEGFNKQQPALAISQPTKKKKIKSAQAPFLPPLAFPLPNGLKESFSAFCQSIGKRRTPAV